MCTKIYTNKCERINAFFQASFVQAMLNFNSCEYHIWAKARSLSLSLSLCGLVLQFFPERISFQIFLLLNNDNSASNHLWVGS